MMSCSAAAYAIESCLGSILRGTPTEFIRYSHLYLHSLESSLFLVRNGSDRSHEKRAYQFLLVIAWYQSVRMLTVAPAAYYKQTFSNQVSNVGTVADEAMRATVPP